VCCGLSQVDNIAEYVESQDWPGLEIVHDLPGRGRGFKATCTLQPTQVVQVVCDDHGQLLSQKDGRERYQATGENQMSLMFTFKHNGSAASTPRKSSQDPAALSTTRDATPTSVLVVFLSRCLRLWSSISIFITPTMTDDNGLSVNSYSV